MAGERAASAVVMTGAVSSMLGGRMWLRMKMRSSAEVTGTSVVLTYGWRASYSIHDPRGRWMAMRKPSVSDAVTSSTRKHGG